MAVKTSVNKVLGAIALQGVSGALTRISADIIRPGDVGLVVTNSLFYIYKAQESGVDPTPEPFDESNPPWILKPEDADEYSANIRWHLVSSAYFANNVKLYVGKYLQTNTIKGDDELTIYTGSDIKVAKVTSDGDFWVKRLTTDSTKLVENLNAEFITGIHGDLLMTRDGTRSFTQPVSGQEPTEADHLTTKNYVDEKINILNPQGYMRRDGSTAFTQPVAGLDPTKAEHLTTKNYVDNKISDILEKFELTQNTIVYKNGTKNIPLNSSRLVIQMGASLDSYTVFTSIVSEESSSPLSVTTVITNKTDSSFTVDFGGSISEEGYVLNWMAVAIPA